EGTRPHRRGGGPQRHGRHHRHQHGRDEHQQVEPRTGAVFVAVAGADEGGEQGCGRHHDEGRPRKQEQYAHAGADVRTVPTARDELHREDAEAGGSGGAGVHVHRSIVPTAHNAARATPKVSGANCRANRPPNVPDCNAISFRSTVGPTTMNASLAVGENCVKVAATNASASEHTHSTTAITARTGTPSKPPEPKEARSWGRRVTCSVAVAAAPITRKAAVAVKSSMKVRTNGTHPPPGGAGQVLVLGMAPPPRLQNHPTPTAVTNEARKRARTIRGCPGKATAVATTTTGLMAGAARRNATAAGGGTPDATSRPATTTELHSQPGSAAPARPATGTDSPARRGTIRARSPAGTSAPRKLLTRTPRTRNGSAWMLTEIRIVTHVRATGPESSARMAPGKLGT